MREGSGLAVGDDLLDDRVVAVLPLGLEGLEGTVREDGVVAPDGEQLALLADGSGFGPVDHPPHDLRRAVTCSSLGRPVKAV